ncbi:MAG TPA: cold shock domain-containing protein, partial [Rheinheimera sp.]|nr:cold shock domain-containing protein [Rheinheimera sp.]
MQLTGTVVFWRDDKGFGFVLCEQNAEKLFFHIRDQAGNSGRPQQGDRLQFAIAQDKQQRNIAAPWHLVSAQNPQPEKKPPSANALSSMAEIARANQISLLFRISFLIAVAAALLFGRLLYVLPLLYLEASIFT